MLIIRLRNSLKFFLFIVCLFSCSPPGLSPEVRDNSDIKRMNIRYVNVNILFDYIVNSDSDAREIRDRKKSIINLIDETKDIINNADEAAKKDLMIKLENARSDLDKIRIREESQKDRILNEIDRTLESMANRMNIDFIFNMGEGAIYAKKEYDITEEALRELMKMQKRNAPVSR